MELSGMGEPRPKGRTRCSGQCRRACDIEQGHYVLSSSTDSARLWGAAPQCRAAAVHDQLLNLGTISLAILRRNSRDGLEGTFPASRHPGAQPQGIADARPHELVIA